MAEGSQSVLPPAIPEIDNTDDTIPDDEEPNKGFSEESKIEINEQQEIGIINQVIEEEEDPMKTLSKNEEEESSPIPDTKTSIAGSMKENPFSSRKQSHRSHLSQRSQQSLRSLMALQEPPAKDVSTKGSVVWLSQRTGKEMKCKFNQTSFIWERKPLAEILHHSSKTPQIREDAEQEETDDGETVTPVQDTEMEPNAMQESAHSMQSLEGTEGPDDSASPVKQESEHAQQLEEQASQHGSNHTIASQPPLSQLQPPNDAMTEGDTALISKKTGKEMKCGFNQTSFIWERKPLAEILRPPGAKAPSPEKDTAFPEVEEIKQASEPEVSPSPPQGEEQELQDGSQQLEELECKQDGGQESPAEVQEAPEEAPEEAPAAPEETLEALEEPPKEALEAPEEAPETPEEAPGALEEAPETPGEIPDKEPEVPEEFPKEALEAPEEAPES